MLLAQTVPIEASDTTGSLHDRLAELGGQLMLQVLELANAGRLQPVAQAAAGVTYAHKLKNMRRRLTGRRARRLITQRIRAFNPFPGATAVVEGRNLENLAGGGGARNPAACCRIWINSGCSPRRYCGSSYEINSNDHAAGSAPAANGWAWPSLCAV